MRPVRQPWQTRLLVLAHTGIHRLLDTPYRAATWVTGTPAATSITAGYRCSTTLSSTSTAPALPARTANPRQAASSIR